MKRSTEISILAGVLLLGALLRGLYLSEIARNLSFYHPGVDAAYHDYWARGLATGNWIPPSSLEDPHIQSTPFFRPPGYPYFLALIYMFSGSSYLAARIVQMLLGLLSIVLAFLLGRRWFGSRPGLIFAGLMSCYWVFIYFEGELLEPVLLVPLGLLLVYELGLWTEKVTLGRALLTGVILGVSALVRPNVLLFAPVALVWALWIMRRTGDLKPFKTVAAGFAVGAALMILPATVRNYVAAHDFVPISSNGGINLYIGNNPTANGRVTGIIPGVGRFETCFDYPQIVRSVETKVGRPLKHSEVSHYFSDQAKKFAMSHPGDALRLMGTRTLLFWGPKEVGHNKDDELERQNSPILSRIPGGFSAAFALAILGAAILFVDSRRRKEASVEADARYEVFILVLLFIAAYFVSYLPFFVAGRYRVPVVPFMLLLGAYGLDRLAQLVMHRDFVRAGTWLVLLLGVYALASVNFAGYKSDPAVWHYGRGVDFGSFGKTDQAIAEYREALRLKPGFAKAGANLGLLLIGEGRIDEAILQLSNALRADPDEPWAHYGMGIALTDRNNLDAAAHEYKEAIRLNPRQAAAHSRLAIVYGMQGKTRYAISEFTQALRINPRFSMAHAGLAMILEGQGRLDEAAAHYAESLRSEPNDATIHYKLGSIYGRQRRTDQAAREFEEAVRLKPDDAAMRYNLGVALDQQRNPDRAIEQYIKAVQLQPKYGRAHKNLAVDLYFTHDYAGAWREVKLCRKYGAPPHPDFVRALSQKMPKPD